LLPRRQRQRHRSNAVKADDTGLRGKPEITVRRLRDCVHCALHKSVAVRPRGMCVLTYIHGRILRKNMGTEERQAKSAKRNKCSRGIYLSFGQPHGHPHLGSILTLVPKTQLVSTRKSFQTAATISCYFSVAGLLTIAE
jgi:hypothetical protein